MNIFFPLVFEGVQSRLSYYESGDPRCFLYFLHVVFETLRAFTIFTLETLVR